MTQSSVLGPRWLCLFFLIGQPGLGVVSPRRRHPPPKKMIRSMPAVLHAHLVALLACVVQTVVITSPLYCPDSWHETAQSAFHLRIPDVDRVTDDFAVDTSLMLGQPSGLKRALFDDTQPYKQTRVYQNIPPTESGTPDSEIACPESWLSNNALGSLASGDLSRQGTQLDQGARNAQCTTKDKRIHRTVCFDREDTAEDLETFDYLYSEPLRKKSYSFEGFFAQPEERGASHLSTSQISHLGDPVPGAAKRQHHPAPSEVSNYLPSIVNGSSGQTQRSLGNLVVQQITLPQYSNLSILVNVNPPRTGSRTLKRLPNDAVDEKQLKEVMLPYQKGFNKIRVLYQTFRTCVNHVCFKGTPFFLWDAARRVYSEHVSLVRYSDKQGHVVAPSATLDSLEVLFKWVLFCHSTFVRRLERNPTMGNLYQAKLLKWLLVQVLMPVDSLPVVGEVPKSMRGTLSLEFEKDFGPVQQIVLGHLAPAMRPKKMKPLERACAIIGIWYKNFMPQLWNSRFANDEVFWESMKASTQAQKVRSLLQTALSMDMEMSKESFPVYFMGNLLVPQGNDLSDIVGYVTIKPQEPSGQVKRIHTQILSELKEIYIYKQNLKCRSIKKSFENLTMAIFSAKGERDNYSYIEPVYNDGDGLDYELAATWIEKILVCLEYFHSLFKELAEKEHHKINPSADAELMKWFRDELFENTGRLPIFGHVIEEMENQQKFLFSPIQKRIISYLTSLSSHDKETILTALPIIGYWYKNIQNELWESMFTEDIQYWEFMAWAIARENNSQN